MMKSYEIEFAFQNIPKGQIGLREAIALDRRLNETAYEKYLAERAKDTENIWHDLPDDLFSNQTPFFSFLDNAGFKFVIPAVIRWSLKDKNLSRPTAEYLFFQLLPSSRTRRQLSELQNELSLNLVQLKIIYRWLKLYIEVNQLSLSSFESKQLAKWESFISAL